MSTASSPPSSSVITPADEGFMRLALDQAHNALLAGEVPVGAVLVRQGVVIATGYNRPITTHDPTAHAEIVALRHASQLLSNYRLPECELYVTLEPCAMCAMAMIHARLKRVVFAAHDPKTGVAGSVIDLFAMHQLNHQTQVEGGVMADSSARLLRSFFAERRASIKALRAERQAQAGRANLLDGLDVIEPSPAHEPMPLPEATELDAAHLFSVQQEPQPPHET